jgi:hypothetical protein
MICQQPDGIYCGFLKVQYKDCTLNCQEMDKNCPSRTAIAQAVVRWRQGSDVSVTAHSRLGRLRDITSHSPQQWLCQGGCTLGSHLKLRHRIG